MRRLKLLVVLAIVVNIIACKKTSSVVEEGNIPPNYKSVATIIVENYVNRLFIDLIGREATNTERIQRTNYLKSKDLAMYARDSVIRQLQWDTTYHIGDSSYKHAYYQRIYDLSKARFMEGATDDEIAQNIGILEFGITIARLNGDSVSVYANKSAQEQYRRILKSKYLYRTGLATYGEMCATMLNNSIYDNINMNSFNYVNASFNDLFSRNPTKDEFNRAYDIIDKNIPSQLFGKWAANKNEYCDVLTQCSEFYEAQIRWIYYVLLQRTPTTQEVINLTADFVKTYNLQKVQLQILKTDEYAQFRR